jgi:hypothetical protein
LPGSPFSLDRERPKFFLWQNAGPKDHLQLCLILKKLALNRLKITPKTIAPAEVGGVEGALARAKGPLILVVPAVPGVPQVRHPVVAQKTKPYWN